MAASGAFTLGKEERLCSRMLIDRLFKGSGSRSLSAYPLRAVYMQIESDGQGPQVQMLVSVPKKCFKRAVKRNRVKRQVREAFRKNKQKLTERMAVTTDKAVVVVFIWLDGKLYSSASVEAQVCNLLERMGERL